MTLELLTLGHGTASADELAYIIREAAIESIVDVISVPRNHRHSQFRHEGMELWIPERSGSTYRWEPALGGFRIPNSESPNVALLHPSFRAYAGLRSEASYISILQSRKFIRLQFATTVRTGKLTNVREYIDAQALARALKMGA